MPEPTTILYAIGLGGKAVPEVLYRETPEEFREALQRAVGELASQHGEEPETVYVWTPGRGDVIDLPLLRSVGRRFGVGH
jgi:predicted Co/Zn/Cd cation transporter (cation efflux family)